jgi:NDP-sugar pyrophosphorylase family protein
MNTKFSNLLRDVPAVVLAGGKGTRLRPFTVTFPKPLVPLGSRPILHRLLDQLAEAGIVNITLALGHLSSLIRSYLNEHDKFDGKLSIKYVEERKPLGTAGALKLIPNLNGTFLVMNGDLLTDVDFLALVHAHLASGAAVTISRFIRKHKIDLGVLEVDEKGYITTYSEKPEHTYSVSMGVYVYEPHVLNYITPDEYLDFPDLILRLLDRGEKVGTYLHRGLWLDIGRPDDYAKAQEIVDGMEEGTEFYSI